MDFDADRRKREEKDRSFIIGGETFTYRVAVAPEELVEWSAMVGGEYILKDEAGKPVLGPPVPARYESGDRKGQLKYNNMSELVLLPGDPVSTLSEAQALQIYERTIRAFLEPGQEDRWAAIRSKEAKHPLNLEDLSRLVRWLFEQHSGRPTGPSSGSTESTPGGGSVPPATESKDASLSLAAAS